MTLHNIPETMTLHIILQELRREHKHIYLSKPLWAEQYERSTKQSCCVERQKQTHPRSYYSKCSANRRPFRKTLSYAEAERGQHQGANRGHGISCFPARDPDRNAFKVTKRSWRRAERESEGRRTCKDATPLETLPIVGDPSFELEAGERTREMEKARKRER